MGKTDADARAVQSGRELVGDRERGCPECTMLMKLGENLDCHIRPRELVGVVLDLLTTKQRFEPTDTPLQLRIAAPVSVEAMRTSTTTTPFKRPVHSIGWAIWAVLATAP